MTAAPPPDEVLRPQDRVIVIGPPAELESLSLPLGDGLPHVPEGFGQRQLQQGRQRFLRVLRGRPPSEK